MLGSRLKHLPDSFPSLGRALDIALRLDLLRDGQALGARHGALIHPSEVLDGLGVVAQVLFACDEDDGEALAEVEDFGDPLYDVSFLADVYLIDEREWKDGKRSGGA